MEILIIYILGMIISFIIYIPIYKKVLRYGTFLDIEEAKQTAVIIVLCSWIGVFIMLIPAIVNFLLNKIK